MLDNCFILFHYWCFYSNEGAFRERTVVRGRQRKALGAKNQKPLGLFSRSVGPNLAIPWSHLGIFKKSSGYQPELLRDVQCTVFIPQRKFNPLFKWCLIVLLWPCSVLFLPKNYFSWFSNRMIDSPKENVGVLRNTRDCEIEEYF